MGVALFGFWVELEVVVTMSGGRKLSSKKEFVMDDQEKVQKVLRAFNSCKCATMNQLLAKTTEVLGEDAASDVCLVARIGKKLGIVEDPKR